MTYSKEDGMPAKRKREEGEAAPLAEVEAPEQAMGGITDASDEASEEAEEEGVNTVC